ncbi:hypothetical protein NLN92_14390 [Citrobacter portucalensis]|uniref:hypothetical protein n=1 Tax=Citrobacter portucalensis TaxID=1639133 RepID=UPI00226B6A19|nr:hypothetical protein [Citrobacter portucalensis]MCX8979198.1 hypothetical protein [Citrobacter portucalensis]
MNEIDSRLRVDVSGVVLFLEEKAMPAQLEEWLRTPQGSVWGWPSWGNPLARFKHEPMNDYTAVAIENFLIDKLEQDLPDLPLSGVRCNPVSDDLYQIYFYFQSGIYDFFLQKESQT